MSRTPEHRTFCGAKSRCTNQNAKSWPFYGGRCITFLFTSFERFYAEPGPKPTPENSIDRIDPNGNYEPGNVRWATSDVQNQNKRNQWILTVEEIGEDELTGKILYRTTATMYF